MSLWRQLTRGLRGLTDPAAARQDVDDEVQHYFDRAVEEYVVRGMSPAEAQRAVRLELGTTRAASEEIQSHAWENVVSAVFADVRYGAHRLRATPGFTAIAVFTLAIGIGGTTAIFSAVYPILFEPLPYPNADRVAMILENGGQSGGTFGIFHELAARSRLFETLSVFRRWQPAMTGREEPERLEGQRVSADYFRVLGVSPLAGRDFGEADDRFHGPNVVILSDVLWRRRFHADHTIVGQAIRLDDALFTVIGVMPHGFENVLAPTAELWMPLQYDPSLPVNGREWGHNLRTIGRLKPGVSMASASRETNEIGRAVIAERRPETYDPNTQFGAVPLQAQLTQSVRPALLVIFSAVALVLVIACVNVTNLLAARGVRRRGEFALRAALGAGRWRLVRQMLTESVLLAALGGGGGLIVAVFGIRALVALAPAALPRAADIGVSASVLAFAFVVTAAVGIAVGAIPAIHASRNELQGDLHAASRQTAGRRGRSLLVVAEVALALILVVRHNPVHSESLTFSPLPAKLIHDG
jgi:putative ABC transport system permease protein